METQPRSYEAASLLFQRSHVVLAFIYYKPMQLASLQKLHSL